MAGPARPVLTIPPSLGSLQRRLISSLAPAVSRPLGSPQTSYSTDAAKDQLTNGERTTIPLEDIKT